MTPDRRTVTLRIFTEDDGSYSAESDEVPGWTAVAPDLATIQELAAEGLQFFLAPAAVAVTRQVVDGTVIFDATIPARNLTPHVRFEFTGVQPLGPSDNYVVGDVEVAGRELVGR
jgi:predicted RNase H-like HicB family nuclease